VRPVNLIPPEDRRGQRAPLRAGIASYAIVAVLALAVAAVAALVLAGNSVAEREAELAALETEAATAEAQAQALSPYAEFATIRLQRETTIQALAQSRFDWERVLRELSLILPEDVWLVRVSGSASPEAQVEGADDVLRASAPGPALSLIGCGASQEAVAGFAAALEDIDGVTRVGVARSELPTDASGSASDDDCRTRDFIARFEITAAFDAVPPPPGAEAGAPLPTAPSAPGGDGGVAEAQATQQAAQDSAAEQTGDAQQAANAIPGAIR
jgi:Tfp pilus assembly protein PilN